MNKIYISSMLILTICGCACNRNHDKYLYKKQKLIDGILVSSICQNNFISLAATGLLVNPNGKNVDETTIRQEYKNKFKVIVVRHAIDYEYLKVQFEVNIININTNESFYKTITYVDDGFGCLIREKSSFDNKDEIDTMVLPMCVDLKTNDSNQSLKGSGQ